jgi:hypothetical protein
MQSTIDQLTTEERVIKDNLLKAGITMDAIEEKLRIAKDSSANNKPARNIAIKEIADIMRGQECALQSWYVQGILSKITKLSPNYIQIISNTTNPADLLRNK